MGNAESSQCRGCISGAGMKGFAPWTPQGIAAIIAQSPETLANLACSRVCGGTTFAGMKTDGQGNVTIYGESGPFRKSFPDPGGPVSVTMPNQTFSTWTEKELAPDYATLYDELYIILQACKQAPTSCPTSSPNPPKWELKGPHKAWYY